MKEVGSVHWNHPNQGATNGSGWSGLPGGVRAIDGSYHFVGDSGHWWSATEVGGLAAFHRGLLTDVIALTMHNEPSMVKEMIKNGARGYLLKDSSKDELVEALRRVVAGETYYSERVQATIMNSLGQGGKILFGPLAKIVTSRKRNSRFDLEGVYDC